MPTSVRSHAKINLGLGIGAPRPDGFHSLVTVYQTLEAHDRVSVSAAPAPETRIRLVSNDPRVPLDDRNTAWKMVSLALDELGVRAHVRIMIEKHLPVQGGLGAGSANAVAALIALEHELGALGGQSLQSDIPTNAPRPTNHESRPTNHESRPTNHDLRTTNHGPRITDLEHWPSRRLELAAQVGSDVPLFLIGGAVLGLDRGQQVYPLPDFESVWCVVAIPAVGVSTPQAFRDWDALCAREGLTAETSADKLNKLSRAYASAFAEPFPQGRHGTGSSGVPFNEGDLAGPAMSALVRTGITSWIQNDFERVVFPQQPSLCEIKRILAADGSPEAALHASLSGSGSALFGLYQTREQAEAATGRLRNAGVESILTRTVPRSEYWSRMLLQSEG